MRITPEQQQQIVTLARQLAGSDCQVRLFGSRLNDQAKGGDVDLLLESPDPVAQPAQLAAMLAAKVSRLMAGRKVDVVICAPNLKVLPIHQIALKEGIVL